MKTLFNKLEKKHPILENTKLLPILLITGFIHLAYFIYGFLLIDNPKVFQEFEFHEYYEKNLPFVIGILISLVLFITWIFLMSKQKSFKFLVQSSTKNIFIQFLCYFFISLWISTFYYSFNLGVITGVKSKYSNKELAKDIEIVNKAGVFLNFDKLYYSLTNRTFDFPFNVLASNEVPSYTTQDYFYNYEDRKHLFYSVKETEEAYDKKKYRSDSRTVYTKINSDSTRINITSFDSIVSVIQNPFDSIPGDYLIFKKLPQLQLDTENINKSEIGEVTYKENGTLKKSIVNIKNFPKYELSNYQNSRKYNLSYYNYSSVLIPIKTTFVNSDLNLQEEGYHKVHSKKRQNMNKFVHELLNSKDKKKSIKKIMSDFIALTDKYEIDRNIDAEEWFKLSYNDQSILKTIIFGTNPDKPDALITYGLGGYSKKINGKNPYIDVFSITNIFYPINNILNDNQLETILSNLYIFFYLAFFLSLVAFTFRISSTPIFITSFIVTAIILAISISLTDHSKTYFDEIYTQVIFLMILYISFIILPYVLYKKTKFIFGLLFNLGLFCFIPLVYTLLYSISSLQVLSTKTGSEYFPEYVYNDVLTNIGGYIHLILIVSGFVFILYSIRLIKKTLTLNKSLRTTP